MCDRLYASMIEHCYRPSCLEWHLGDTKLVAAVAS